jgi:hypothetical protein
MKSLEETVKEEIIILLLIMHTGIKSEAHEQSKIPVGSWES